MREKVKNLIYLDTQRYMSIDNLTAFYWGILIIPFFMIVMGVVSIQVSGGELENTISHRFYHCMEFYLLVVCFNNQKQPCKKNIYIKIYCEWDIGSFVIFSLYDILFLICFS